MNKKIMFLVIIATVILSFWLIDTMNIPIIEITGKAVFGDKSTMYAAFGSFGTFLAVLLALAQPSWQKHELKEKLKKGLLFELKSNFEQVFTGEPERRLDFSNINLLRLNSQFIKSSENFELINNIYKHMELFDNSIKANGISNSQQIHKITCKNILLKIIKSTVLKNELMKLLITETDNLHQQDKEDDSIMTLFHQKHRDNYNIFYQDNKMVVHNEIKQVLNKLI